MNPYKRSSLLCIASENGHLEIVKVMIAAGASVNQANNNGVTPLYIWPVLKIT